MSKELLKEIDLLRTNFIKYTRKAYQMLPRLEKPRILDIGCGSGLPTIELAKLSGGEITGIDIDQSSLDELKIKIKEEGFSDKIRVINLSLFDMNFQDESFDVIWAEGSMSVIGFKRCLKEWRRFLKKNGFLVIHDELSYISDTIQKIPYQGYKLIDYFLLPANIWWIEFYRPLEKRINDIYPKYKNDLATLKLFKKYQNEITMVKENPEKYRSEFYILQKL